MCGLRLVILLVLSMRASCYDYHYLKDTTNECFVSFLKEQNTYDEYLNSVRVYNEISQECRAGVAFEKENLLAQMLATLQSKQDFKCVQKEVQGNERFSNLLLNMRVVQSLSDGNAIWFGKLFSGKKTPKDLAIDRINAATTEIVRQAEMKCELTSDLGNLFDSLISRDQTDQSFVPYEPVQEHCIRNELQENSVIDRNQFQSLIDESFKGRNTNCNEILMYLRNEMIESLNDFDSDNIEFLRKHCVLVVLKESNDYFHQLLKVELLAKNHLSMSKKQTDREIFIDKMFRVTMKVRERCS